MPTKHTSTPVRASRNVSDWRCFVVVVVGVASEVDARVARERERRTCGRDTASPLNPTFGTRSIAPGVGRAVWRDDESCVRSRGTWSIGRHEFHVAFIISFGAVSHQRAPPACSPYTRSEPDECGLSALRARRPRVVRATTESSKPPRESFHFDFGQCSDPKRGLRVVQPSTETKLVHRPPSGASETHTPRTTARRSRFRGKRRPRPEPERRGWPGGFRGGDGRGWDLFANRVSVFRVSIRGLPDPIQVTVRFGDRRYLRYIKVTRTGIRDTECAVMCVTRY